MNPDQTDAIPGPHEFPFQTGWLGIDDNQRAAAGGFPTLAQAAPRLLASLPGAGSEPILLHLAWRQILGKFPPYPAQQIGDCVSFGHAHANDLLQCIEIAAGEASEYRETDTEFIYATSREVAGILGRGDGSYGSAAIKAMKQIGIVSREMLGPDGPYSGSRAKSWGRTGAPDAVKQKAGPYRLGAAALVQTWDELVAALQNGYPVTICTARGFNMTRDAQGFCRMQGRWGHCMFVAAVRFDREGALVIQSWGPNTPSGPLAMDQPDFSFWAERAAITAILQEGDSWAISKSPEFVARPIPTWRYSDAA